MCRDSNGGVIEHRQRRRSFAFTHNDLQEQYLRHLEELTSSHFGPIRGSGFHGAGLNLDCFEGVLGWMVFGDSGRTAGAAVRTLIVTPASYVVRFHGKERDTGNGMMV